jgi:hypothetical protein
VSPHILGALVKIIPNKSTSCTMSCRNLLHFRRRKFSNTKIQPSEKDPGTIVLLRTSLRAVNFVSSSQELTLLSVDRKNKTYTGSLPEIN